jgi:hypothetical protein
MTEANTTITANVVANTISTSNTFPEPVPNPPKDHSMDVYSKYLDHITSSPNMWKTDSTQYDIAVDKAKNSNK